MKLFNILFAVLFTSFALFNTFRVISEEKYAYAAMFVLLTTVASALLALTIKEYKTNK